MGSLRRFGRWYTVVLKPAEQTPVTALELAKLIQEPAFRKASSTSFRLWRDGGRGARGASGHRQIAFTGSAKSAN